MRIVCGLWLILSAPALAVDLEDFGRQPIVTSIDGDWTAEIKEVLPLNQSYVSNPGLRLDQPFDGQTFFPIYLQNQEGLDFVCGEISRGKYQRTVITHTAKIEQDRMIRVSRDDKGHFQFMFMKVNKEDLYYRSIQCTFE